MCSDKTHRFYFVVLAALLVCALFITGCPKPKEPAPSDVPETGYDITDPANQGDVHGIVYVDGRPQAFGIVQIYDTADSKLKECRTNTEGSYTLCDFRAGMFCATSTRSGIVWETMSRSRSFRHGTSRRI